MTTPSLSVDSRGKTVSRSGPWKLVRDAFEASRGVSLTGSIARSDLADVLRQFKFLHESGCEMLRTLEILGNTQNPVVARMFRGIRDDVEAGISLADAFHKYERRVGNVVVSTIRAAEESGTLAESLEFLADNISKDDEVRRNIRRALAYPAITGSLTLLVFLLCLLFVVPAFEDLYQRPELGSKAPEGMTAVIISMSRFLTGWWMLWIPVGVLMFLSVVWWVRSNPLSVDRWLLRVPLLNRLLVLSDLSRFGDRLGLLLSSGVPILKAVTLAKETVANRVLRPIFARMATQAEKGRPLSEAFAGTPHLPDGVIDMIRVGEEAGALPATLSLTAANLRKEMDRLYARFTAVIQPIGIFVVAGMVLVLVIALFKPYLEIIENIGSHGVLPLSEAP